MAAFDGAAVRLVVHDLPVAAGHLVLADEERALVEHADAPVEFGGHEFLRDAEIGFFQQLGDDRLQLDHVVGLLDAAREGAVGDLEHDRESEVVGDFLEVGLVLDDDRLGRRQAGAEQSFPQIDLVRAAHHRDRIVDDGHALCHGAPGETVGVVGDRRRLADHQRVEFGEAVEVLAR